MKKLFLLGILMITVTFLWAQNSFVIYMSDGTTVDYPTSDVDSIVFVKKEVTPPDSSSSNPSVSFTDSVQITRSGGWFESGFVEWTPLNGASDYNVYYKNKEANSYTAIDKMLIRNYGSYIRADIPGLPAGSYDLKIVPVEKGKEGNKASVTSISTKSHNREGFAHFNNNTGVGAYNNDGSLKENAVILYITEKSKSSISLSVQTSSTGFTECVGISAILKALQKGYESRPICLRLIGKISIDGINESGDTNNLLIKASSADKPVQNITIEGIGEDAVCYGFGIRCNRARSIEVRNLAIMLFGDDGIALETANSNIWIHNNDIFYGTAGSDADQAKGDGSMDLKNDSKYITISYNHFWDSGKMSLCGMKSETGENWISYHHNWFDHSDSRHPRIRTMSVHIYNNYYDGVSKYGVGVTYRACAFVENNYFRNCKYPMLISMQGSDSGTFSGENGGIIKSFNNYMSGEKSYITYQQNSSDFDAYEVTNRTDLVPSDIKCKQGATGYNNFDTNTSVMYSYTPDPTDKLVEIIENEAGRINGGDFAWEFDDSQDDDDYAVNNELMQAIQNYASQLVSIFGE